MNTSIKIIAFVSYEIFHVINSLTEDMISSMDDFLVRILCPHLRCLFFMGLVVGCSNLLQSDCPFFADLYTAFASEAFLCINRHCFFILELEDFDGTNIDALATANTFFLINFYVVHNLITSFCVIPPPPNKIRVSLFLSPKGGWL
jgi:hypothetical protein